MKLVDAIVDLIIGIIIIAIVAYVFLELFIAFLQVLWNLNPITSIGFFIAVIFAFLKGEFSFEKLEDNIGILVTIFGGTVISYITSYAADALTQSAFGLASNAWQAALAGDFIGAIVIIAVMAIIWLKAEEIRDMKFS